MDYCTVDDVLNVATDYRGSVEGYTPPSGSTMVRPNTKTIAESEVESLITEASVMVDSKLAPRYQLSVIQAIDPLPPVVVYLTKTYAAIMMYQRYDFGSIEKGKAQIEQLQNPMTEYKRIISNGSLLDSAGELVPRHTVPSILLGKDNSSYPAMGDLDKLYSGEDVDSDRIY